MQAAAALHLPREADEASQDVRWMNAATALLVVVAVCGLLTAGLQRLGRLPLFTLRQVQLEGDLVRNNVATVRANTVPRLQGGFFQTDLGRAREAFEAVAPQKSARQGLVTLGAFWDRARQLAGAGRSCPAQAAGEVLAEGRRVLHRCIRRVRAVHSL